MILQIAAVLMTTFVAIATPLDVEARTWIVAQDGSGDTRTMANGMLLAAVGDTVLVMHGSYAGGLQLKSGVTLIGSGADVTFMDGGVATSSGVWSNVRGFTLTGATIAGGGIDIRDCVIADHDDFRAAVAGSGSIRIYNSRFARNRGGSDTASVGAIWLSSGELRVQGCTFEEHSAGLVRLDSGEMFFRNNIVRNNENADFMLREGGTSSEVRAVLEDNLFTDNRRCWIFVRDAEIRRNTFARTRTDFFGYAGVEIEQNLFTESAWGLRVWGSTDGPSIRCNNSWGNTTNWWGIPRPSEEDGNISEDPLLCDPNNDDFSVAVGSPCIPINNPCGRQIGAFGQGCAPVSVSTDSWARVKARYR